MPATPHTLDQQRLAANLAEAYATWMEAVRATRSGRLRWKRIAGHDYLYRLEHGGCNGSSLGPRSTLTEGLFEKAQADESRVRHGQQRLLVLGRLYKAARLPTISRFAGAVLRQLDQVGLLGSAIRVVGTTALPAYELEAGASLETTLQATEDLDLSWVGEHIQPPPMLLEALRGQDGSWTVSMERTFQIVNARGEVIDLLIAPSLLDGYPAGERVRALPLEGQDDLLAGTPVEHVVADLDGRPARIVAPDPRRFALHKCWLAEQPGRSALKRRKDAAQAEALLSLVRERMPGLALDGAWVRTLPPRLRTIWVDLSATERGGEDDLTTRRRGRVR